MSNEGRRVLGLLVTFTIVALIAGCGSSSSSDEPPASVEATETRPATQTVPTEVVKEETTGVLRTAREKTGDAGGWVVGTVQDGGSWVWDRVSGAGTWIWDGVSGAGSWMWNRVTELPSDVADVFRGVWSWIKGSSLGSVAAGTVESVQRVAEGIGNFSITGLLWKLVEFILYVVLTLVALIIVVWSIKTYLKNRGWKQIKRSIGRLSKMRSPTTSNEQSKPSASTRRESHSRSENAADQQISVEKDRPGPTVNVYVGHDPYSHSRAMEPSEGIFAPSSAAAFGSPWSRDQLVELRTLSPNQTISELFELVRARNGGSVNHIELQVATNRSPNQLRYDFAAFTEQCLDLNKGGPRLIDITAPTDGESSRAYTIPRRYLDWWFES